MISLDPPFRVAVASDAAALAELVNFAGEGLPVHLWTDLAADDQDPWEIGRLRQADKAREGQIVVADFGGGAVASLTGYVIASEAIPIGPDFPPLFKPLQELENQALDSWYVNVLACYPDHRGQGLGSGLLDIAERIGRGAGMPSMSVIVADTNTGARRLYERQGYRRAASVPCVKDGWETETENWVLLMKGLD